MKKILALLLTAYFCMLTTSALAELVTLVEHTTHAGIKSYSVLSSEEYKSLQAEVKKEIKYFSKAIANAKKDWMKDEATKRISFPSSAIIKPSVRSIKKFSSVEKAEPEKTKYDEALQKKLEKDATKLERKCMLPVKLSKKATSYDREAMKGKVDKKKLAALQEKEDKKNALYAQGLAAFETKLGELMGGE